MIRTFLLILLVAFMQAQMVIPKAHAFLSDDVIVINLNEYEAVLSAMYDLGHVTVKLPEVMNIKPEKKPI